MKLKVNAALFHCRRCRKSYSSPLGHVCVTRNAAARGGRLAPKVTVDRTCACGKPAGNPLTHVCAPKSDFRRQLAASKKAAAKSSASAKPKHLYQSCRDDDCERVACEAFREGRAEGYRDGYDEGSAADYAAGLAAGLASKGGS